MRKPLVVGLVGALAIVAIAIAVLRAGSATDSDVPTAAPVIAHVHGLGVNPADDSLIVATHNGAYRLPEAGPVERVGTTGQDTMGFTIVGPDHFLGSGHPDGAGARAGQPGRLGLIESTDGGDTWTSRSLSGDVDFHAIASSAGITYGWDSGTNRVMASTDNNTWETRSTLQLFSLAVDPADRDHLVATTPRGPHASRDGGRTWQPILGAARVVLVSWAPKGTLWGLDRDGVANHSSDAGSSWTTAGQVAGKPQALLALDDRIYAVVTDQDDRTAIHQSTDAAGSTWQRRYLSPT